MSRPTRYPRRDALRIGGLAVAALAAAPALTSLAACADPAPPVDLLEAPAAAARTDAALATRLAEHSPERAEVITAIAEQRTAHAEALTAEIERVAPPTGDKTPAPAPADDEDDVRDTAQLADRLRAAAAEAAGLVADTADYQAGLLGAIAASCAAQAEVLSL